MSCDLGYKTEQVILMGVSVDIKPLELCPKPITNNDLLVVSKKGK